MNLLNWLRKKSIKHEHSCKILYIITLQQQSTDVTFDLLYDTKSTLTSWFWRTKLKILPCVRDVVMTVIIIAQKATSHAINSHDLTGENPFINQAIHVLLMHGFCTLHTRILGSNKK